VVRLKRFKYKSLAIAREFFIKQQFSTLLKDRLSNPQPNFVSLNGESMLPRNPVLLLSTALITALMMALAQRAAGQTETRPFVHNGYSRPYIIHRSVHLTAHPVVVFMLGGIRSTAKSTSEDFNWVSEADRNGFLVVFPEPVATRTDQPAGRDNITFWEMKGSRTHQLANAALAVDDEGYLMGVLREVLRREHADRKRIFFAGFSSGSGAVQLLASRHPKDIRGIVAVATPLMDPPAKLDHPVPILYIHGDNDEQFSGFEVNSPHFATTPHGNWVTWGKDTGSGRIQPFVKPQSVADTDHAVRTVEGEVAVPSMVRSRTNVGFRCQAMAFGEYLENAGTYCRRPFSESWRNPSTVPREHQRSRSNLSLFFWCSLRVACSSGLPERRRWRRGPHPTLQERIP
jgi:poly(3-hydroxybutyrate) depolymerase